MYIIILSIVNIYICIQWMIDCLVCVMYSYVYIEFIFDIVVMWVDIIYIKVDVCCVVICYVCINEYINEYIYTLYVVIMYAMV